LNAPTCSSSGWSGHRFSTIYRLVRFLKDGRIELDIDTIDRVATGQTGLPPPHPHVILIEQELHDPAGRYFFMDASVHKHEDYRARASECLHDARTTEDRQLKNVFHRLAVWWVVLAHEIEDDQTLKDDNEPDDERTKQAVREANDRRRGRDRS
jgi:hypothetical protein